MAVKKEIPPFKPAPLTVLERVTFIDSLYSQRMKGVNWKDAFPIANSKLPKEKRFSKGIEHPNKIGWMKSMLEAKAKGAETMEQVFATRHSPVVHSAPSLSAQKEVTNNYFTSEERNIIARIAFESKKNHPELGWKQHFAKANEFLPNKKVRENINHPKQISWVIPLLAKLEKESKKAEKPVSTTTHKSWTVLNQEEKMLFAQAVYKFRKEHPQAKWREAMDEGRKTLKEGRKIGDQITHPCHLPWIASLIEQFEKADKARPMLDLRKPLVPAQVTTPKETKPEEKNNNDWRKNPRSYLKPDEKMLFAEAAYRIRLSNAGIGWAQILIQANQELPPHRQLRSTPHSASQLPWLPPLLAEIAKRPPEPIYEAEPESSHVETSTELEVSPVAMPSMEKLLAGMLANALQSGNLLQSPTFQKELMSALMPAQPQPVVRQNGIAQDARPKVMIVGLLPVQTNEIQVEYGKVFNLKFFGSNTPSQQIKDSLKHVSMAVLMTKFTSHSTQAAMRGCPGFVFCNGNSSALKQLLAEKVTQLGL